MSRPDLTAGIPNYTCPRCGAQDSTHCDMLVPVDVKPYTEQDFDTARKAGCRVALAVIGRELFDELHGKR
jgi:hypothetical protein